MRNVKMKIEYIRSVDNDMMLITNTINTNRITIKDVAKVSGIRPTEITKFLTYKKIPRLDQFYKIWNAIDAIRAVQYEKGI